MIDSSIAYRHSQKSKATAIGYVAFFLCGTLAVSVCAAAQPESGKNRAHWAVHSRSNPEQATEATIDSIRTLRIPLGKRTGDKTSNDSGGVAAGECGGLVENTHDSSNFAAGQFLVQAGFQENEIFAAQYAVDPGAFPITIRQIDFLIAQTVTFEATTTHYTLFIWDGAPGTIEVARFNSMEDLQPVVMEGGPPKATQVQVYIDPEDNAQIMVENLSGTNTFSVGVRIDEHNNPSVDPCNPDVLEFPFTNAFPAADTSGVSSPSMNWVFALNCPGGCPSGWKRFDQLGACSPSGDWVIKATYGTPLQFTLGTCCEPTGICTDAIANTICCQLSGSFFDDMTCADDPCPELVGACCAFGTCLPDRTQSECVNPPALGTFLGSNTECGAQGACCMSDGSCAMRYPDCCEQGGGTYQGAGVTCAAATCPQPRGACCFGDSCFPNLEEENCTVSGTWLGPNSTCSGTPCTIDIIGSFPPHGAIDARQPSELNGSNPTGWSSVELTFDGATAALESGDFTVATVAGNAPTIDDVVPSGNMVTIVLNAPIPLGAWTRITHVGSGTSICLGYLPGDVNGDGTSAAPDILAVIDCLNGVVQPPCAIWQCDVDRDGDCAAPDILRVIDLQNGAAGFDEWRDETLASDPLCP